MLADISTYKYPGHPRLFLSFSLAHTSSLLSLFCVNQPSLQLSLLQPSVSHHICDVEDWKTRLNDVLAKPSEHINQKSPEDAQSWHEYFFGCCSPIDLCLITWCLPCVTFGKTHHRIRKDGKLEGYELINTSCLLMRSASCCSLHWIPLSMQRADIRAKYNLQGNCLTDIAAACCCGLCDLVQQEKESAFCEP